MVMSKQCILAFEDAKKHTAYLKLEAVVVVVVVVVVAALDDPYFNIVLSDIRRICRQITHLNEFQRHSMLNRLIVYVY
jgi:hypothetical protein